MVWLKLEVKPTTAKLLLRVTMVPISLESLELLNQHLTSLLKSMMLKTFRLKVMVHRNLQMDSLI